MTAREDRCADCEAAGVLLCGNGRCHDCHRFCDHYPVDRMTGPIGLIITS